MENIFLFIFLLSPVLLIIGLVKPGLFSKVLKTEISRGKALIISLGIASISFMLFGFTAKPTVKTSETKATPVTQEQKNNETLGSSVVVPQPTLTPEPPNKEKATVVKVVDGDTMDFSINGKTERVRVIGINTPETVDPRKSVECFGKEASNKAKELLKVGAEVKLEADASQDNRDKYSRLLRYVWIDESTDFGLKMIKDGYAYEYTYEIPYKYQSSYKQVQKETEEGKRGLWADNVCLITPKPTVKPTTKPTSAPVIYIAPTNPPSKTPSNNTGGSWSCDCSKTCPNISSCEEAQYLLNVCGCGARDGDKDGIACDGAPLHCQN